MFERDKLDPADSMRIERNIYFEEQTADLSGLTALPLEQLQALREEYAAAEQAAFEALQEQAATWDEQAGKTLAIDKAIEYVRTPEATHTANQWEATDYGKHISNRVYQMRYHISENTRYDREKRNPFPIRGRFHGVFTPTAPTILRTGKNRRTGKESLCRQGSYGKISEWGVSKLSAFIHRGIAAYPARVCRAFQSKRAAFTGAMLSRARNGRSLPLKKQPPPQQSRHRTPNRERSVKP